jgi:glyoxylase-like metal-dependent hydrolase (beta-lactamase superfamily II)
VPPTWFEVYRADPGVNAICEPHQWEEIISWLIVGTQQALLFDTGMGMYDIRAVATSLTHLPIEVLNSHTHHDHVGENWRFAKVFGTDDPFRKRDEAGYTRADVASEVAPSALCGVEATSRCRIRRCS